MRQPIGELAAGMAGGAVSRRTVGEAIDAVANAALAQHAVNIERHRSAHVELLQTLQAQQEEASRALEDYRSVTKRAEELFRQAVADLRRTGKSEASVDQVLERRKELLESELKSQERYRERAERANEAVNEALKKISFGVGAGGLDSTRAKRRPTQDFMGQSLTSLD